MARNDRRFFCNLTWCAALLVGALGASCCSAEEGVRLFSLKVLPLLSDKCFHCHGPDEAERPTELRLDTQEGIVEAFAGGDFEASEAWRRISSTDPDEVMPPVDMHKPFRPAELVLIREWMEAGAPWSPHWAFMPPQKMTPPEGVADHPIDAFVRRRLAEEKKNPADLATKEKLLRRATLDLHGLPPTPEEIDAFLADDSPGAWDRVLTRLFASPRYGERMAVDWLDGARYADTNGFQNDFTREMWPWRNWVIEAYNRNQPFDEFTIDQLAGDLLPDPTDDQVLATGFNRNNRANTEGGSISAEWLVENVVDRVETTSAVFLGLTMGCARCHDHKYDPVSQEEFYEFFAFFHNVNEKGVYNETRGNAGPQIEYLPGEQRAVRNRLIAKAKAARETRDTLRPAAQQAARAWLAETEPQNDRPLADAAIRLDAQPYSAVAEGERVVPAGKGSQPPKPLDLFLGKGVRFAGKQRLEYGELTQPARDRPMSVTAWVRRERAGVIWSKMNDANAYRGADWYLTDDGRLAVHLVHNWPGNAVKVTTERDLPANQWIAVTTTYDGSSRAEGVKVYFGLEEQPCRVDVDGLSGPIFTDQPLRLGRRSGGKEYVGGLARVRFYNRVLTPAEVRRQILQDVLTSPAAEPQEGRPVDGDLVEQYAQLAGDVAAAEFLAAKRRWSEAELAVNRHRDKTPTSMVMEELPEPRDTYVLIRGEYDKPDKDRPVTAATPDFLGELPTERNDRLALAEWIVSRDNPLTARVVVNRLWARLFGIGLVKTEENLGVQCDPPSHPDLLDWLAVEFIDSGWDVQHMLRLMMTSHAYRQASAAPPETFRDDPHNRLLARGPRRRLQAEFVRDNALALSGLLNDKIGGPSVMPYQPEGLWAELAGGSPQKYVLAKGESLYRRSLYTYRKRTVPHPTMTTFDAPGFDICTVSRSRTNTPLQALALLNDVTYVEAARKLGERMLNAAESDPDRLRRGFRLATSRGPTDQEMDVLLGALERRRSEYHDNPEAAEGLLAVGDAPIEGDLDRAELAAYAMMANLLLNLDETITVE